MSSFLFGRPVSGEGEGCVNQDSTPRFLGALQGTGDDLANPGQGKTVLVCFQLSENPFANPAVLYRVQIIEREVFSVLEGWKKRFEAEVYDINAARLVGRTGPMHEGFFQSTHGIGIPELVGSKLAIGLGPGSAGGVDSERTGTAWWVY